jgi:hypothetical protein
MRYGTCPPRIAGDSRYFCVIMEAAWGSVCKRACGMRNSRDDRTAAIPRVTGGQPLNCPKELAPTCTAATKSCI